MSKTTTTEFLIRYLEDFDDHKKLVNSSCKKWNVVAQNQLKRKINYVDSVYETKRTECVSFDIHFQNGSKAHFLFIPKNITTYDLHEEIREAFKEDIKEAKNISFNLLNLNESHQKVLLSTLSSCVELYKWESPKYGKKAKKVKKLEKKNVGFYCDLDSEIVQNQITYGENIAKGTNLVRTLCITPTNYMTSKHLVDEARKIAKRNKLKFTHENEDKLKQMGAGSFLSVIQGTKGSDGGIVHIQYRPKNAVGKIGLIGKGVVFDTGGYDVKTDESMIGMHRDMTGAAVSLGLFEAIVKSKLNVEVNLYLAIAENLISEVAYKPNDVVTAMDGTAIEVKNTDAEGRMCLVDTLLYSRRHENDLLIDFATLTGAAIYSIDQKYSCLFSNCYGTALKGVMIGQKCGERVWNFPSGEDYMDTLNSDVADISQCTSSNNAEHIYAASFLQYFVKGTPWIHLDLASEHNVDGLGLVDTEVTGFGVRWGFEFIKYWIEQNEK